MLYMICATDVEGSLDKRLQARPAHLERLHQLKSEGRLILAGPFPAIDSPDPGPAGFTGSLVVAEFGSLEDAQSWANDDPYVAAGVYESVVVKPYKKSFTLAAIKQVQVLSLHLPAFTLSVLSSPLHL